MWNWQKQGDPQPQMPYERNTKGQNPRPKGLSAHNGKHQVSTFFFFFKISTALHSIAVLGDFRLDNLAANTLFQQHKRWLYTWISLDGQYWNQIDYSLCSQRWRGSIRSANIRLGADCGSDHELLIAKFRLKLKKEKTTRLYRYDLNQIP